MEIAVYVTGSILTLIGGMGITAMTMSSGADISQVLGAGAILLAGAIMLAGAAIANAIRSRKG